MTYWPLKDRSELMKRKSPGSLGVKSFEGGVVETSFMFQVAWPASIQPGLSPMRGSWLAVGGVAAGAGVASSEFFFFGMHATAARAATTSQIERTFTGGVLRWRTV